MSASSVAIVILNWNGRKMLEQFLPSVLQTSYPACQVYVADNASTDDSMAFLRQQYPEVKLIVMDQNRGYAGGYNEALKSVKADYYMILNSDVAVEPNWLQSMVSLLDTHPQIAACQPKILSFNQPDHFEYAGAAGGWMDAYGYPFCRGRVFETMEPDSGQYHDACPVAWASGAALMVRSKCFHEVGGFDAYFFAHQEEIDLCWRLQAAGFSIYVCPASVVYHLGGGTLPRGNNRKTFLNFRNNLIMLSKNLPAAQKWRVFPMRAGLDLLSGVKELFAGKPGYFYSILRAWAGFLRWRFFHRKQSPRPSVKIAAPVGFSRFLLPWQYFVRGRRRFSELQPSYKSGKEKIPG